MRSTVISHFFNEAYLLPWWLDHHTRLFDHGILIDYGSTDRSAEICRELAPNWELVSSKNPRFRAATCDQEVMVLESRIRGWKMALNTTEFLCCPDMPRLLSNLENQGASGGWVRGVVMADLPASVDTPIDLAMPLVHQRHDGYFEDEVKESLVRSRLIHRRTHGAYAPGRHHSAVSGAVRNPSGALVLWFGFSPWTDEMRARKLQIQSRIPKTDRDLGLGAQHFADLNRLEEMWAEEVVHSRDLRESAEFTRAVSVLPRRPAVPRCHSIRTAARPPSSAVVTTMQMRVMALRSALRWWRISPRRSAAQTRRSIELRFRRSSNTTP